MNQSKPLLAEAQCHAPSLSRRRWARAIVTVCGLMSLGPWIGPREPSAETTPLESWLRRLDVGSRGDVPSFAWIGAKYLASHPEERSRRWLNARLSGNRPGSMASRLLNNIAQDWRQCDVTVVERWVLARTEARICALRHLMDSGSL